MPNSPNYSKVCQDLLKDLSPRAKEIISRRFGFETSQRETLEAIGQVYGLTRERIRQIEENGISAIKKKIDRHQKVFNYFANYLKSSGGLKREDILLSQLGKERFQSHVFFLLTIDDQFSRFAETEKFYPFWVSSSNTFNLAQKIVNVLIQKLTQKKEPLSIQGIYKIFPGKKSLNLQAFSSFIEISKEIEKGIDGLYGLRDWPEVSPRGLKDKAFLALKKERRPLHFQEVALAIDKLNFASQVDIRNKAHPQTVHNELIKDPRFVLVGRGIYALSEWGYAPGYVKDIILKILKEKGSPLGREEIIKEVSRQRLVKTNTILLNLQNKKYFLKTPENKYTFRTD